MNVWLVSAKRSYGQSLLLYVDVCSGATNMLTPLPMMHVKLQAAEPIWCSATTLSSLTCRAAACQL